VGVVAFALSSRNSDAFTGSEVSPQEVHELAARGDVLLIDIRRPDEWRATGIPEHGYPIDMRDPQFLQRLLELTGGDADAPIALICARGVRSDRVSAALASAGFSQVIDVAEGMLGSRAGPGWLARDLPVSKAP
jgi:rhodanese-related sulfurtransferase